MSAGIGMAMAVAGHGSGWPIPRGGSQKIADALAGYLRSLGGEIVDVARSNGTARGADGDVRYLATSSYSRWPASRLPASYRRSLEAFRYGPGVFKMDWALDAPVPWRAAECARAGNHPPGRHVRRNRQWERGYTGAPFILLAQPSLFDDSRAPAGRHTALGVLPRAQRISGADMTDAIEAQMERFAPGFRSRISRRARWNTPAIWNSQRESDRRVVTGGAERPAADIFRPTPGLYRTPLRGVFLCSASTPPGGGVHGMCGFHAAQCGAAARPRLILYGQDSSAAAPLHTLRVEHYLSVLWSNSPARSRAQWVVLVIGFGGLLACIMGAALRTVGAFDQERADQNRTLKAYLEREDALDRIRSQIYLSGTYVRDLLLSPDPGGAAAQNSAADQSGAATRKRAMQDYGRSLDPAEREPFHALESEIEKYWGVLGATGSGRPRSGVSCAIRFSTMNWCHAARPCCKLRTASRW